MDKIQSKVISIIANFMDLPESFIEMDTDLKELGIDSLDRAGISLELDRHFHVCITDRELSRIEYIHQFVDYVKKGVKND